MGIVDIDMVFLLNAFSYGLSDVMVDEQHMGIANIYMASLLMVFLLNVFSCGLSDVLLDGRHMGIADICMVFLLNVFSDVFSNLWLYW